MNKPMHTPAATMLLSQSAMSYAAHRASWDAQHAATVQPEYINYFGIGGQEISRLYAESSVALIGRVFTSNGRVSAKLLADGRIAEQDVDTRGLPFFAVFQNKDDFQNWERPMTRKEMFEEW